MEGNEMKTNKRERKTSGIWACILAILIAGGAAVPVAAQGMTTNVVVVGVLPTNGPTVCDRVYVDPMNGDDNGSGTLASPYKHIQFAIYAAIPPAVVVALPGTYSFSSSGEVFPIWMLENVSLQGTSAMNTILDGEGDTTEIIRFQPMALSDTFNNVLIDGVMITGGETGIYMESEFQPIGPHIANCFIVGNGTGVHIFALYDSSWPNGYPAFYPRLINNTIAHNYIGILDEGNWVPWDPDPDGLVEGEAAPAIVNCLIYPNVTTDIEGVDGTDIKQSIFCTVDQAGISRINAGLPWPRPIQGSCMINPATLYVNAATFDYRIMPTTLPVDRGTKDLHVANGNSGKWAFPCGQQISDADAEGYGNPRFERQAIDVGADEQASWLVAGYVPKTTTFGPDPNSGALFTTALLYLTPYPALTNPVSGLTLFGLPFQTGSLSWSPSTIPGARPVGTSAPILVFPYGTLYIDVAYAFRRPTLNYPPVGTALVLNLGPAPILTQVNTQVVPFDGIGGFRPLTALQSFTWKP
jgi:hypothetical protein